MIVRMNDMCVELLVKKPDSKVMSALHTIMMGLGVVLFLAGLFYGFPFTLLGILLCVVGLLFCGGAWLLGQNAKVEYEYLYLDKELSVDKIKNQSDRKKVATYKLETMEVMAPKASHRLDPYQNLKVRDFSSETKEGNAFELVVEGEKGKERIIIDTNEELIKAMRMAAPRYVFTD